MNFIFLSCTENYPVSFSANNTKIEYISRGLVELRHDVHIINRINGTKGYDSDKELISSFGARCFLFQQKQSKIFTALRNLKRQITLLRKLKIKNSENILVLDTGYVLTLLLYVIFAKIMGYKMLHIITEWPVFLNKGAITRWDSRIYLYIFGYFCDGFLPISESLAAHLRHFAKPILKMPILSEYTQLKVINNKKPLFAYCANAGYTRIISFVLDAANIVSKYETDFRLVLILYGNEEDIKKVKKAIIDKGLVKYVIIRQKILQTKLLELYRNAIGLLIPLDPNSIQDRNRFSQKIAEYISTGTPIITSPVGEVTSYFKDKENAVFASDYNYLAYAESMLWVIKNKISAQEIGTKGYKLGDKNFNYKIMSEKLIEFVQNEMR